MTYYSQLRIKASDSRNMGPSGLVLGYNNERIITGGLDIDDTGLLSGPVADAINCYIDDSLAVRLDIREKPLTAEAVAETIRMYKDPAVMNKLVADLVADRDAAREWKNRVDGERIAQQLRNDKVINKPFGPDEIGAGVVSASREKAKRTGRYTDQQLDEMFNADTASQWATMYAAASAKVAANAAPALDVTQVSFVDEAAQPTDPIAGHKILPTDSVYGAINIVNTVAEDELADAASGAHQHVNVIATPVKSSGYNTAGELSIAGLRLIGDPRLPSHTMRVVMDGKVVGSCVIDPDVELTTETQNVTVDAVLTDPEAIAKVHKASATATGLTVPGAGDWTFKNRNVADNFDQHVREQLPWYDLATGIVAHVGRHYLPQRGLMYDIGASTGNITRCLEHELVSRECQAISIDSSESMCDNWRGVGNFVVADARTHAYKKFHFGVCFLTLMFLPVADQRDLLDKLVKNIAEGGALLIFDKTEAATGYIGTVMQRLTLAGKMAQGASYEDVVKKELSLAGVQRPINPNALLTRHGAVEIFRFGEFAGWLIGN